jgi:hypothetical protein
LVTHPVRQRAERVGGRRVNQIHGHHDEWHQATGTASLRTENKKTLQLNSGQRPHRCPPPATVWPQALEVFSPYRVGAFGGDLPSGLQPRRRSAK